MAILSETRNMDMNSPMSGEEAVRAAALAVQPGAGAAMGRETEATPEEQAEYEEATRLMNDALYEGKAAEGVAQMLTPDEKVGSVAKASAFAVTQLDAQHDFDDTVIADLTEDTVDKVVELYEAKTGDEFDENEQKAALGAAWEAVMGAYGVDADGYAELTAGLGKDGFRMYEDEYNGYLRSAKDG